MGRITRAVSVALVTSSALCPIWAAAAQAENEAFVTLAEAYAARDARMAAASYASEAEVIYAYDGTPEELHVGRDAIARSFDAFFAQFPVDLPLDLNFRIADSSGAAASGFYRLRLGATETSYGRFDVERSHDGLFIRDRSGSATRSDFEETPGPLLVAPDDSVLDRGYYGLLTGRYRLPGGCDIVVTRSTVRLFARNTCDQSWRGLTRVSGLEWIAGDTVLADTATATYRFEMVSAEPSRQLTISVNGTTVTARRADSYTTTDVHFTSEDGTGLAGTLYLPIDRGERAAATVLVHGSGPQDRDGYASIIAVLADALASEGRVVLAYDKRGSGGSQGDGDRAGFDTLAGDAAAAMRFLAMRAEVDPARIGLAGSSQAGWVVARAIAEGAAPADIFLLGAAGTAFSVREQNIYNTDVRMACAGISRELRETALEQQTAFFDALADRGQADRLDGLTQEASTHPEIRDWLFPDSAGLAAEDAWFTVLDPTFDPLPVWRGYRGRTILVFSEFDDSTDTAQALRRLENAGPRLVTIAGAQHLGLVAESRCDSELADRTRFSAALFEAIAQYARADHD